MDNVTPQTPVPPNTYPPNALPPPGQVQQPTAGYVYVQTAPPPTPPAEQPAAAAVEEKTDYGREQVIIYSHSNLFYWWPVWAVGFLMAFLTYLDGMQIQLGNFQEWFHPSQNLGVIWAFTLFLVILITSVPVRGLASLVVILTAIAVTLLFAYLRWWDEILAWFGRLSIHMNMGFYMFFSTLLFLVWALNTFVFDRMSYWRIKPGQVTQEFVFGAGAKSYDTNNMTLEKYRDDIFRHWVLGLGSGDLRIRPMGAGREDIYVPNVLFIGAKAEAVRHLIATEPDSFGKTVIST
jgi:hypothetical protein